MRLFAAVNPPTRLRRELDTRLDAVRSRIRLAWTRQEAWHLTLMFLGDWPPQRLPALGSAMRGAVARHRPVVVRPREVGAFPGLERPRVLFLHLDGGDPLRELAAEVRQAVDAVWPDGPQDHKHFRPHLTLARIKRPLAADELAELRDLDLGEWESFEAGNVELMASDLQPRGTRYSVVESLPLGG